MDLSDEQVEVLETLILQLETLDPAELPGPAAELVDVLSRMLDADEDS